MPRHRPLSSFSHELAWRTSTREVKARGATIIFPPLEEVNGPSVLLHLAIPTGTQAPIAKILRRQSMHSSGAMLPRTLISGANPISTSEGVKT